MSKLVLIILAILLPPLAVYLKTKSAKDTIINIVLCLFFWVPGLLHALYLILK
ncbi:MAG TPA: YqaE/Pmp3 family membrane protein [Candidatus Paceibacterota bacterium]|nr:YqaE/Pmp3 family membrane protein [Verrucomicrobiota bacterium]HSA10741.1 YqaE/Pmp3 family membrane protein [Candidatus Paceibacterota bacterium]